MAESPSSVTNESPALSPSFYEGKWAEPDYSAGSLRNWLVKKERFFLRRLAGKKGLVLDLGCGGGWKLYTRVGPVIGVDLSTAAVAAAQTIYSGGAVADLAHLPFRDGSFDYVVSSDVLGHILLEDKDQVLHEIRRVLKKGGETLHYIETEASDPLTQHARARPSLYRRYFLEPEGHLGLEPPRRALERFRKAGFRPLREETAYRMLLYLERFLRCFDNEYAETPVMGILVRLGRAIAKFTPLALATNVLIALALELTDRLFPSEWGSGVLVHYANEEEQWN